MGLLEVEKQYFSKITNICYLAPPGSPLNSNVSVIYCISQSLHMHTFVSSVIQFHNLSHSLNTNWGNTKCAHDTL